MSTSLNHDRSTSVLKSWKIKFLTESSTRFPTDKPLLLWGQKVLFQLNLEQKKPKCMCRPVEMVIWKILWWVSRVSFVLRVQLLMHITTLHHMSAKSSLGSGGVFSLSSCPAAPSLWTSTKFYWSCRPHKTTDLHLSCFLMSLNYILVLTICPAAWTVLIWISKLWGSWLSGQGLSSQSI